MFFKRWFKAFLILIKESFYKHTFTYILSISIMLLFRIMQIEYKIEGFNFIFCAFLLLIGILIFYVYKNLLKSKLKKIIFTAGCLYSGILVIIILCGGFENIYSNIVAYYKIIQISFFNSSSTYFYHFTYFLIAVIPFFIAAMLYLNSKGYGWLMIALTLSCFFILGANTDLVEVKAYILIFFMLYLLTYSHSVYMRSLRLNEKQSIRITIDNKRIINYLLLISIVAGIFSYAATELFGTKSIYARIEEFRIRNKDLLELTKSKAYDLTKSGYENNTNRLGGPIFLDFSKVFEVNSDKPYYLKGISKDYYDGFSWSKTESNYTKMLYDDQSKAEANIEIFMKESNLKADAKTLDIFPDRLNTSTIFAPVLTYKIELSSGDAVWDNARNFMMLSATGISKSYKIYFYESDEVKAFLSDGKSSINLNYDEKTNSNYTEYLQLPDNIPMEEYSLVFELTKDCKTPEEKAIKIMNYLNGNYTYSLNVSEVPKNKEFTSYFLFDEKKGYCTYFATACTVLFRIAGLPARYVEGFKMGDEKDEKGLYMVTNAMAHAWTEVLVDSQKDIWAEVDTVPASQQKQAINEFKGSNSTSANSSSNVKQIQMNEKSAAKSDFLDRIRRLNFNWVYYVIIVAVITLAIKKLTSINKLRNKIIYSESFIPLYHYVKNRITSSVRDLSVPDDDYEWIDSIQDIDLRKNIELLINSLYEEFYGRKSVMSSGKKEIYFNIEGYLLKKKGLCSYYLDKAYFFITYREKYLNIK